MKAGMKPDVFENNGKVVGFFTGADYTSEHEWGTEKLQKLLKEQTVDIKAADCTTFGLANRMISAELFTKNSLVVRTEKFQALIIQSFYSWRGEDKKAEEAKYILTGQDYCGNEGLRISYLRRTDEYRKDLVAAWDESSLGIAVGPKYFEAFDRLVAALEGGHGFLGFSRMFPVFDNGGLVLMDARELPKQTVDKMEAGDRDIHALHKEHRRIGIQEKLDAFNAKMRKKTGKDYWSCQNWDNPYAVGPRGKLYNKENFDPYCAYGCLSPSWTHDRHETKYKVVYWLNPQNQRQNYFGWVTVEDLLDWMKGTGKIPGHGFGLQEILRSQKVAKGALKELYSDEVYCKKCGIVNTKRETADACPKCGNPKITKGTR
jgi:hypothetical protein